MNNILFFTLVNPKNNDNGGNVYTNSILNLLKYSNLSYNIISLSEDGLKNKSANKIYSIFKTLFYKRFSSKINYFYNESKIKEITNHILYNNIDTLIIDHIELSYILDFLPKKIKTILINHNIESELLKQRYISTSEKFPLINNISKLDVKLLKDFEINTYNKVDYIISISNEEIKYIIQNSNKEIDKNIFYLPPTFNYEKFNYKYKEKNIINLTFLGNMNWWPNNKAMKDFIANDWNHFLKYNCVLNIYGKGSELFNNPKKKISGYGFVDNISDVWENTDCMILPIRSGAGVNIKTVEALYNNIPCIGYKEAFRGIEYPKEKVLIVNDYKTLNKEDIIKFIKEDNKINLFNTKKYIELINKIIKA